MNLLHVDSSILGDQSVSRSLSAAIVAELRRRIPDLHLVYRDLDVHPLAHMSSAMIAAAATAPDKLERALAEEIQESAKALEEFLAADIVVVGAPMYNMGISSQLKSWIDRLVVAGKTFRYTPEGTAVGMMAGKTVIVVSARGGYYAPGSPHAAFDFQEPYLRTVFGFLGIADVHVVRAEGLAVGEDPRKQALAEAHQAIAPLVDSLLKKG